MTSLLGAGYESSSEDDNNAGAPKSMSMGTGAIVTAPDVSLEVWSILYYLGRGRNANISAGSCPDADDACSKP
jgi:hypothetical protein